jgi:type IV pilus assembly protein PilC
MFFLVICVTILMLVIAPKFHEVYSSFGAELPLPTLMLMNGSKFVLDNFIVSFLALVAACGAITLFSLSDKGSFLVDTLKLKIPFFGLLIRESLMSRFSRTLGLLLTSSVPVLDALHYVSFTLSNVVLKRAVYAAREKVKQGKSLHHALEDTTVFPSILTGLVATGEETGKIESLLAKVADFYDNQVSALIARMTSVIEPVLIIIVAIVVGTIVVVMYLPLFYLGLALRRGI